MFFLFWKMLVKKGRYVNYSKKSKELSKDYSYIYEKEDLTEKDVSLIK